MIAFARDYVDNAQDWFVAMLPQIRRQASIAFRSRAPESRAELIQEVIANAYVAYARLVELGKQDLAYATPLASYAVRQVLSGRRVGTCLNIRDVTSPYAQAAGRVKVESLDRCDAGDGEWKQMVVEDRQASPADVAVSRLDLSTWFRELPSRQRRIAKFLGRGETTKATAKKFAVSTGRVSQLRRELRDSWRRFQGELNAA